jgi:hypothetical protein
MENVTMLLIVEPDQVDQIIMFVPADYKRADAEKEAKGILGGNPYIAEEVELDVELPHEFCFWRGYVG